MICKKCGAVINDNEIFCSNCGENQALLRNSIHDNPDDKSESIPDGPIYKNKSNSFDMNSNDISLSPTTHSLNTVDDGLVDKRLDSRKKKHLITIISVAIAIVLIISIILVTILPTVIKNPNTESTTLPYPSASLAPSAPPAQITINDELLSDIGRTYGEIKAKYGEGTDDNFEEYCYTTFGNSRYRFNPFIIDDNNTYGGSIPLDMVICDAIDTNAEAIFGSFTDSCSVSDVEKLGVSTSIMSSRKSLFAEEIKGRFCHFEYGNCEIDITLNVSNNEFTKDSKVFITKKEALEKQAYQFILNEYTEACQAYSSDSGANQRLYPHVNEVKMSLYHTNGNTSGFYYCYKDINNDGVDELFIGNGSDDYISIVDLYLFDGDTVIKALDTHTLGYRAHLTLYTDGTLYERGSNSMSSGIAIIYKVNDSSSALEKVYDYEYEYNETGGWYYNESETISANEFNEILNSRTEDNSFNWEILAEPKEK